MGKILSMNLKPADELFTTQEQRDDDCREKIVEIKLSEIDSFPNHPFRVEKDNGMDVLVNSIRVDGVQTPAIVRLKTDGRYEMISGHRRKLACQLAELETLPCIIRDMDDDEAVISMVDANLQRERLLPSEKAKSYKMRYEAMKRHPGRPKKENVSQIETQNRSDDELAKLIGISRNQLQRFLRLAELVPMLLEMVDAGKLPVRSAVEISYISPEQQQDIADAIISEAYMPTLAQITVLRKLDENKKLNNDVILEMFQAEPPNQLQQFKITKDNRFCRYFPEGTPKQVVEDTIYKALELWYSKQSKEKSK